MNQYIVDANAFLRLFLNDIPNQADQVEDLFEKAKGGKAELLVLQITVFEILFALDKYYHFPKQNIIEKLKSIISSSYLKVQNREIFKKAVEIFEKENLSFADCFLVSYGIHKDIPLFTFDKVVDKLSKK